MSKYLDDARRQCDKIKYYYEFGRESGYSQAVPHYNKLCGLIRRASESKNNKNDSFIIQRMMESSKPLMQEMKQWQDDYLAKESQDSKK